jgi:hypothetical protein
MSFGHTEHCDLAASTEVRSAFTCQSSAWVRPCLRVCACFCMSAFCVVCFVFVFFKHYELHKCLSIYFIVPNIITLMSHPTPWQQCNIQFSPIYMEAVFHAVITKISNYDARLCLHVNSLLRLPHILVGKKSLNYFLPWISLIFIYLNLTRS